LVGAGLKCRPDRNEIDLGYRFMKKYWGKGYATEAASACLQHGFTELHVQKIVGRALPANLASITVLEKSGMQYNREEIIGGFIHKTYYSINPTVQS